MIVDDSIANLKIGKNALADAFDVFTVPSAAKMFDMLERNKPDLILMDVDMPEMDGYEAVKILKSRHDTRDIPVIFLTAKTNPDSEFKGLSMGAIDYITKPFLPTLLRKRVEVHLTVESQKHELKSQKLTLERQRIELQDFNDNLQMMVNEKTGKIFELQNAILQTVADLVESRDNATGGHVARTQRGIELLLEAINRMGLYRAQMREWDINLLLQSSQLHDVGKIAISDTLLNKAGKLTSAEFEEMKKHAAFGETIIARIADATSENDFLKHAKIFAGTHHEKWDGSGYPLGLSGEEIPLQGRIMAIADVYDALVSKRPYKVAYSKDVAEGIILAGRGTHFDPTLVDAFSLVADRFY
jgi:putative two-component system response regulator